MIKDMKPLSLAEANELVGDEENKEIKDYIKKFSKLKPEKAEKLRQEIGALDNMKIKAEHVAKVIDLVPETSEEVNKIFIDAGLNEDEINKILEIVKKYS